MWLRRRIISQEPTRRSKKSWPRCAQSKRSSTRPYLKRPRCSGGFARRANCAGASSRSPARYSLCAIFPGTSSRFWTSAPSSDYLSSTSPAKDCPRDGGGRVTLDPGDMLIAYSDGVVECRNSRDEEFDTKRLSTVAGAASNGSANQALFSTLGAVLDFVDGCSPADDLTLMVVRRREGALEGRAHSRAKDSSTTYRGHASVMQPGKAAQRGSFPGS